MPIVSVGQLTITDVNDGLSLVLSNNAHTVPTDANGNSPVLTGAVSVAKVLAGGVDVSSQWSITTVSSVGVAGSYANNTYTVTALTVDVGTIDFTASKAGSDSLTARFTVTKAKKGDLGNPGLNGLTIVLSNESHTVPANSAGTVSSYANSGTTIRVYEGSVELNALSSATSNGSFTVGTPTQLPASTIGVGARSYSGKIATVAVHSAMVVGTDSVVITYPITIRRANGETVNTTKAQTITKSKQGIDGGPGGPGPTGPTGPRGSVHLFKLITGSVWSDAEANLLFASGQPNHPVRVADRVTLYNNSAGFSQTRAWTGNAWQIQTEVLDGSLLVTDSVTSAAINTAEFYAQNAEITGSLRVGNETNYVQLGGDTFIRAQTGSEVLFSVPKTGFGLLQGAGLMPGSVLPDALSSETIQRIRDELGGLVPQFGGTQSRSSPLASGTYALTAINSDNSNVEVSFSHLGSDVYSAYSIAPSVTISIRRGSTTIHSQSFTGESILAFIGDGVYIFRNILPIINLKINDATPGTGSIVYSVVVTVNHYAGSNAGNFNFVIIQSASGGEVKAKWSNISGTPATATRWPGFGEVTGTAAAAQIPNLDAGKVTTGTFAAARIPNLAASVITSGQFSMTRILTPVNGNYWNGGALTIGTDGVTELGRYLDFHDTNSHSGDYTMRVDTGAGKFTLISGQYHGNGQGLTNLNASSLAAGTIPDARLSGTYSGFTHKIDGSNTVFTTPSSGSANAQARTVYGLAEFRSNVSSAVGAIVFKSPTNSTAIMMQLEIAVMLYSSARISHITVQGYRSTATVYANLLKISKGTFDVQVRFATEVGTGKTCIVLGNESSTWSYPHLSVIRAMFSHNGVTDTFCTGWTTAIETTLAGYENFTADIADSPMVGSITGNAATAMALQTARSINGTNFNGSAAITTANWGTARTLTVGNTGKSVNGSGNVSWSLSEIGAPSTTGAGASGTWGISVTGSAATLSGFSANSGASGNTVALRDSSADVTARFFRSTYQDQNSISGGLAYRVNTTDNYIRFCNDQGAIRNWLNVPNTAGLNASGTWGISITGNATTATTLQTARTINGTNFNGSAAITTANWGTARTLTIGNTGKSVNGSGNVSWSLAEIGAEPRLFGMPGPTNIDWNMLPTMYPFSGFAGIMSNTGTTNNPSSAGFGGIYHYPQHIFFNDVGASSNVTQVAWPYRVDEERIGIRSRYSGTWSTWREILTSISNLNANNLGSGTVPSARLSGSYGISITGNAATATTLQTARTINGTSFNGSANITTANWGTARTLTVGNTGKSVNGSGNVSWSLAELGALPLTGGTLTGMLTISRDTAAGHGYADGSLELRTFNGSSPSLGFHRSGFTACQLRHDSNGLILSGVSQGAAANFRALGDISADSNVTAGSGVSGQYIGSSNTSATSGRGISLYGGAIDGMSTFGISFAGTGTFGTHGSVTGDWATYFTMNNTANRGWIFKAANTGAGSCVASINNVGNAHFNGTVTAGSQFLGISMGSGWINGHRAGTEAAIRITNVGSVSSFHAWISQRTPSGGWAQGVLGDNMYFNWATNANIDGNVNQSTQALRLESGGRVVVNNQIIDQNGVKFMKWSDFTPNMFLTQQFMDENNLNLAQFDVVQASFIAAGVLGANLIATNGFNVVSAPNDPVQRKFTLYPGIANGKIAQGKLFHFRTVNASGDDDEDLFYIDTQGEGYFKGSLARGNVDSKAISESAKRAINPYYTGDPDAAVWTGNQLVGSGAATTGTIAIGNANQTPVRPDERVTVVFEIKDSYFEESTINLGWQHYTDSTYTITLQRRIGTGSWVSVTGQSTTYKVAGYNTEPYQTEDRDGRPTWEGDYSRGYSYSRRIEFVDVGSLTGRTIDMTNVQYRLFVNRTVTGLGTSGGLRFRLIEAEKDAFIKNTLQETGIGGGSDVSSILFIDKESGYATYTAQVRRSGHGPIAVAFPKAFKTVHGCTLGYSRGTETSHRYPPRYSALSRTGVTVIIVDGETSWLNTVTVTVTGTMDR